MIDLSGLTIEAARNLMRAAYDNQTLTAQNGGGCWYSQNIDGKQCTCIVGAVMPYGSLPGSLNGTTVDVLVHSGELKLSGPEMLQFLNKAQHLHDEWAKWAKCAKPDDRPHFHTQVRVEILELPA